MIFNFTTYTGQTLTVELDNGDSKVFNEDIDYAYYIPDKYLPLSIDKNPPYYLMYTVYKKISEILQNESYIGNVYRLYSNIFTQILGNPDVDTIWAADIFARLTQTIPKGQFRILFYNAFLKWVESHEYISWSWVIDLLGELNFIYPIVYLSLESMRFPHDVYKDYTLVKETNIRLLQGCKYHVMYPLIDHQIRTEPDILYFFRQYYPSKEDTGFTNSLDDVSSSLLNSYTYRYDKIMNGQMRSSHVTQNVYRMIQSIQNTIDHVGYDDLPVTLFRGMGPWFDESIGTRFSDRGFMSKSTDPNEALSFGGELFLMYYPYKGKQIYISPVSEYTDEDEYITYPGEIFEIFTHVRVFTDQMVPVDCTCAKYVGNLNIDYTKYIDHELDAVHKKVMKSIDLDSIVWITPNTVIDSTESTENIEIFIQQTIMDTDVIVKKIDLRNIDGIEVKLVSSKNGQISETVVDTKRIYDEIYRRLNNGVDEITVYAQDNTVLAKTEIVVGI